MAETHSGSCYCGAVEIEMTGPPLDMGYCHCANCRRFSGAPFASFTLWAPENVKVTKGADLLTHFQSSEMSDQRHCSKCGTHVMIDHAKIGLVDVRGALPATIKFKPTVHLNYDESVLPMKDGLPKLRDFPKEIGGSGETMAE